MKYSVRKNGTWEELYYSSSYDAVVWIEQSKTYKYSEEGFLFTFEQVEDLTSNLLVNDDVLIYCVKGE